MHSRLFNKDLFLSMFLTNDKIKGSINLVLVKELVKTCKTHSLILEKFSYKWI